MWALLLPSVNIMANKEQLLGDIEKLLNAYPDALSATTIDTTVLEFLDEESLKGIITSLLEHNENVVEENREWLTQFKSEENNES